MIPATCPRLFEAEAMRDGRLAGAERTSFVRHTTSCASCRREVQALEAIAVALRAPARGDGPADELQRVRARTRLIAELDRTLVAPRRRAGMKRPVLWSTSAVAVIAAAIFVGRTRAVPNVEPAPALLVRAAAGAVWSKHAEAHREKIVLAHGELWIRVDHGRGANALTVELPDGELEDTGTTFTVSAADGRTTRVAVEEGSVVLRIRGRPPVAVGRTETWAAERPTPARVAPSAPVAGGAPQRARTTAPAPAAPARRASAAPRAPTLDEADPALDFRAAVALLDSGAQREAAAAFARFIAQHARDPRAEDAAYLRVIALQRCGADDEMKRAAQEYLRLYPGGFRRGEVETLSRERE
jgi:hypothetical protein